MFRSAAEEDSETGFTLGTGQKIADVLMQQARLSSVQFGIVHPSLMTFNAYSPIPEL